MFGDRLCITSNTEINKVLSGQYINSCCKGKCGYGCNGGHPEEAWKYIKSKGLCTGGEYDSKVVSYFRSQSGTDKYKKRVRWRSFKILVKISDVNFT